MDFFTVPTVTGRVLFVLLVLAHERRRVVHFNVTEHPTAEWTAQQIVDAFPNNAAPRWLLRDRDSIYSDAFKRRVAGMAIIEVVTSPASPWQNAFVERLIGSIRRECLNYVIVLNAAHLRRVLTAYLRYYHGTRTHLGLKKGQLPALAHAHLDTLAEALLTDETMREDALVRMLGARTAPLPLVAQRG